MEQNIFQTKNKIKNFRNLNIIFLLLILGSVNLVAQYNLEQALIDAKNNNSSDRIVSFNNSITALKLDNISTGYYPKVAFMGQATYQSAVTELPIELPGITINALNKDQYRFQGEIKQLIYDGGGISKTKEIVTISNNLNNLETDIEFENIRAQVINLYFGILEINAKSSILELKKQNIESNIKSVEAGITNGVLQATELYELQAAIIGIAQELNKINALKSNAINSLKILTNSDIDATSVLYVPTDNQNSNYGYQNKLIFKKLDIQKDLLSANQALNETQSLPKIALFLNLGYANPALNFLQNSFEPYAMGGIQLSWSLNSMYTKSKEREILQLTNNLIDERKTQLTKSINMQRDQYINDQNLLAELIKQDEELLGLRTKLRENAESKFKNGILTANRLIPYINDENELQQSIELRKLQIIKNQYLLDHLTGNYSK